MSLIETSPTAPALGTLPRQWKPIAAAIGLIFALGFPALMAPDGREAALTWHGNAAVSATPR